jgi:hypothetical protein
MFFTKRFLLSAAGLLCLCLSQGLGAVTVTSAQITIRGDDRYDLYFNGVYISPHTNSAECFFDSPFYCKQTPMTWTIPASLVDCGDNVLGVIMYDIPGGGLFANYTMHYTYSDGSSEDINSDSSTYGASNRIDTWYAGDQASGALTDPPMQGTFNWTDKAYVPAGASSTMAPCLSSVAASIGSWYRAGYDVPGGGLYSPPCCSILDSSGAPAPHIFASDCESTNQWPTIGLSPATSAWYFRHTFQLAHGPVCLPTPTPTPPCNYIEDLFPVNTAGLAGNTWNIQTGLQTWDGNWANSNVGNAGWWSVGNPLHSTEPIVSVTAFVRWRAQKPGPDGHLLFNYCVASANCTAPAIPNVTLTNSFTALWESASFTVPPPAGGWTWAGLSNIAVFLQNDSQGGGSASTKVIDVDNVRLIVEFLPSCGTPSFTRTITRTFTYTPSATPTATPTRTATPTATPSASPSSSSTPTASFTFTPSPTRSPTPSFTPTPSPTPTFSATPTRTPTPTASSTPSPTPTYTFTVTFTASATATPSYSATPSYTATSTKTSTPTASATPSWTLTSTPTVTFTASASPTPTLTATLTYTATSTKTSTPTASATPSWTLTSTPTVTFTASASPTPTLTATLTYTATSTKTSTLTPTASPSATLTYTTTATKTATSTATLSFTASPIASDTASPSITPSSTISPSATPTVTSTSTPSATPSSSATPTDSPTPSNSPSPTESFTASPLASDTASPTVTPTSTATRTFTPSASPTATPTPTRSFTDSFTPSPPASPTASRTVTPTASPSRSPAPSATPTRTPPPAATATVSPTQGPVPARFKVLSVYPNPVPPTGATFVVSLPRPGDLRFTLYDLRGEVIWEGKRSYAVAGNFEFPWPVQNSSGAAVSYGAYYLRAKVDYSNGSDTDGRWISVVR